MYLTLLASVGYDDAQITKAAPSAASVALQEQLKAAATEAVEPTEEAVEEVAEEAAEAVEEGAEAVEEAPVEAEAPKMEETILSPEEQKMVDEFAEKIDIENTNQILQYGAGTQKKMADFSDSALANVKTQDMGEVGNLLAGVVTELKDFDAFEDEKGFFAFFKKQGNKLENLKNRYAKAEVNVEKIADALQQHQIRLMKDSAVLDKMYEQNLNYY